MPSSQSHSQESSVRYFRPGLQHVAAYRAGKPAPVGPGGQSIKLSSNENPYPPLESVQKHLAEILGTTISRYPSIAAPDATQALAKRLGVEEENIVFGAGSVEVAAQLIHALTAPGDEVIFAWRSFEAYPILTRVAGAVPVEVPLDKNATHDLEAMAEAITARTRIIFVCNPNNPTGTTVGKEALDCFMAKVPKDILVVIDEAYVHFDISEDSPNGLDYFWQYPNVAVLHTFSKAYGLAGLRIGYAVAKPGVATQLRKVAIPFAVNRLAQEAVVQSIAAESELNVRISELVSERQRVADALLTFGLPVVPSQANFIWLELKDESEHFATHLEQQGISVRTFAGEGVRITIGTVEENDSLISALDSYSAW